MLERFDDGRWTYAWGPGTDDCMSPPITIEPGATYTHTIEIVAFPHGGNAWPQFAVPNPTGVYRIVWFTGLASYDPNAGMSGFGPLIPLEHRTSNWFVINAP